MNAVMARNLPRPLLNGLTRSSPYGRRWMRLPAQVSSGASFVSLVHSLMLFILESHKTSSRFYSPTGRQILYTTIVVVAGYDRLPRCLSRYTEGDNLSPHFLSEFGDHFHETFFSFLKISAVCTKSSLFCRRLSYKVYQILWLTDAQNSLESIWRL